MRKSFSLDDEDELSCLVMNAEKKKRIAIFDLDGTIHKGNFLSALYEASNADLAYNLFFSLFSDAPKKIPPYIINGSRILYEVIAHKFSGMKNEDKNPSEFEEKLIREFSEKILYGLPLSTIEKASQKIPNKAYPYSKECVREIAKCSDKTLFISKTFIPVLEAYQREMRENYSTEIDIIGNRLETLEGRITGLNMERPILSSADKRREIERIIPRYESAIFFVNSEDDLGMFDASDNAGFKGALKIAMNGSSEKVIERCDAYFSSWIPIKMMIEKYFAFH
ncbi:MAG: hypothetical protein NTV63_01700 [Candidatus Woesearchaeota archaeon]|nr:hypothetical protein [Candidatus Woesearchaeota archaeon]